MSGARNTVYELADAIEELIETLKQQNSKIQELVAALPADAKGAGRLKAMAERLDHMTWELRLFLRDMMNQLDRVIEEVEKREGAAAP